MIWPGGRDRNHEEAPLGADSAKAAERASQSFFDEWSEGYEEMRISPWFRYTQELTIEHLQLTPESRVLDIGCGTGYAVRRAAELVPEGRAVGLDISPGMIDQARALTAPRLRDRIEFRLGSSAELAFDDNTFTHVICTNSFHHYPDPLGVLGQMRRVLEPGGTLLIFENAPDLSLYTKAWDLILSVWEEGHVKYYPSHELGALIRQAGFSEVELLVLRNELLKHGKLFASIQLWKGVEP